MARKKVKITIRKMINLEGTKDVRIKKLFKKQQEKNLESLKKFNEGKIDIEVP